MRGYLAPMPMALHGKEGGSSSHAMEEGEELRRRGLLLLGTYAALNNKMSWGKLGKKARSSSVCGKGTPQRGSSTTRDPKN